MIFAEKTCLKKIYVLDIIHICRLCCKVKSKMDSMVNDHETEETTQIQGNSQKQEDNDSRNLISYGIEISRNEIKSINIEDQDFALKHLGVSAYEQEDFEEGVIKQVDKAIEEQQNKITKERIDKDLNNIRDELETTREELTKAEKTIIALSGNIIKDFNVQRSLQSLKIHKETKENQLQKLQAREKSLLSKLESLSRKINTSKDGASSTITNRDLLKELEIGIKDFETNDVLLEEMEDKSCKTNNIDLEVSAEYDGRLNFEDLVYEDKYDRVKSKKRKLNIKDEFSDSYSSSEEYIPYPDEVSDELTDEEDGEFENKKNRISTRVVKKKKKKKSQLHHDYHISDLKSKKERIPKKVIDDGDIKAYHERMRILRLKKRLKSSNDIEAVDDYDFSEEEENDKKEISLKKGFSLPYKIWRKLYKYQRTGVKWLWELHNQDVGGIMGDEMGLGKTIQAITFLTGVRKAKEHEGGFGPILITCPATVLHQWVKEFHKWSPEFRVAVLHESGSFNGRKEALIKHIVNDKGVIVTSYSNLRINQDELLRYHWDYVILDEGHKIRNPDAEITLACKQFATPHRLILSGSPLQNNLKELWSLFDFIFPGKLGTLPVFLTEFSVPITLGGYANATDVQAQTAFKCACILRDTISPYLLRRMKKDVNMSIKLPSKNEQVLFCRLTDEQRDLYKKYINSHEVSSILTGRMKIFPGLIMLRKICNHPDLSSAAGSLDWMKSVQQSSNHDYPDHDHEERKKLEDDKEMQYNQGYGFWKRSGKMIVVESLLKMWKQQNHRVLLFSQSKQMLDILELFVKRYQYTYMRMDGSTSIGSRQPLVDKFNKDKSIFILLLTTRVGGLGLNLTGADRVVIYDPDWNPSTDTQARERSWRIGQDKHVTIYRLLTTGTIEEKIYHRQIFKQFLVNRVLKNPAQRRFFKSNDLYELFTLGDEKPQQATETSALFAGTGSEVCISKVTTKVKSQKKQKPVCLATEKRVDQKLREKESTICINKDVWAVDDSDCKTKDKAAIQKTTSDQPRIGNTTSLVETEARKAKDVWLVDESDFKTVEIMSTTTTQKSVLDESYSDNTVSLVDLKTRSANDVFPVDENDLTIAENISNSTQRPVQEESRFDNTISLEVSPKTQDCKAGEKVTKSDTIIEEIEKEPSIKDSNENKLNESGIHQSLVRKRKLMDDEKNKKKKKRKRKVAIVEGRKINYLDKHANYKDEDQQMDEKKLNKKHDKEILNALFKSTGVHSALKHDKIVEAGNPDYVLVEKEAERVAKQAAEALRRSRALCRDVSVGVPTWTGTNGSAGIPTTSKRPRFGVKKIKRDNEETNVNNDNEDRHFDASHMFNKSNDKNISSAALLERMRARNAITSNDANAEINCNHYNINLKSSDSNISKMIEDIRHFVTSETRNPGKATTQEILQKFKPRIENDKNALFKEMLKQVCDFQKINGVGTWLLKESLK